MRIQRFDTQQYISEIFFQHVQLFTIDFGY
jgi:hypothetical protein